MSAAFSALPALPALSEAVSVRYAREQYAIGYLHGLQDGAHGQTETVGFARFYVARCERSGRLVDVAEAYRRWLARSPSAQLVLFAD
ncbi:MAG: hypothetical protein ACRDQB_05820 [Thermocrispum sp.]